MTHDMKFRPSISFLWHRGCSQEALEQSSGVPSNIKNSCFSFWMMQVSCDGFVCIGLRRRMFFHDLCQVCKVAGDRCAMHGWSWVCLCECRELLFGARFGNLTSLQELHRINQGRPLKTKGLLNLKRLVLM